MKKICVILFTVLLSKSIFSQQYNRNVYTVDEVVYEKLYLHVDRMMYSPGESIWFKVYLVSGVDHKLIKGNKNVYIQLVDPAGNIVDDRLILTSNGTAIGDFDLSRNLTDGYYTIRGFTKYQQNFGEESYFHKKIWISGVGSPVERPKTERLSQIQVAFYPESGSIVENSSNTIAFKVTDTRGHGIDLAGYIINDLGDTITPFKTEFLGMGSFKIMPKEGRTYYAKLPDYPSYSYEFTEISVKGAALHFIDKSTSLGFVIARNYKINGPLHFTLKATHKGYEILHEQITANNFYHEISYSKERFPLGITKFTLSNEEGVILAERLVFVQAGSLLNIHVQSDSTNYHSRSKATVHLEADLENLDTVRSGLSVSVVNRNYLNRNGLNSDLLGFLLLDSELRGAIESSASYFTDAEIPSSRKLDLLMMVQGWRSYYWPEIRTIASQDSSGWDDVGLTISGHVKRLLRDDFVANGSVTLGPISPGLLIRDTITDSNGYFSFNNIYLLDSSLLVLEARTERGGSFTEIIPDPLYEPEIFINNTFIKDSIIEPLVPGSFFSDTYSMLEAERRYTILSGNLWIDEVEIKEEVPESFFKFSRKEFGAWMGTPERSYYIEEDNWTYVDIFDFFETNITGVIVQGDQLIIRGMPAGVMIDGIPLSYPLEEVPMSEVEYIDILTNSAALAAVGNFQIGGVISIYTSIAKTSKKERYVRGRYLEYVNGFQVPRSFYSPTYSPENKNDINPDFRPTLLWDPYVMLENRKATLEFFTADFQSDYVIIVEGISNNGVICKGIGEFSVRMKTADKY